MNNLSKIDKIKSFLNLHENKLFILFLIMFFSIVTVLVIWINSSQGILGHSYRDIYFYLIQGLRFSGYEIGGYEYVNYLSPLIPFLTSLAFRLGFINETSIFIVTGIFYPLGILAMYFILKLRFNNMISFFGSFFYGALSINLLWVANGSIDIPSVSLTMWAIYLMILAVEKNQKYFYLAFPVAILAFFAKYPAGLVIPLMICYLASKPHINHNIKKYYRNFFGGLVAGFLTAIPFLAYFYLNKIPLGFINQAQEIATSNTGFLRQTDINNNLFYYFTNIPRFIYNPNHIISWFIIAIVVIGLSIAIYKAIRLLQNRYINSKRFSNGKIKIFNKKVSSKFYFILILFNIIVIGISFLTASKISFVYSEMIFFLSIFSLAYLMNKLLNIYSSTTRYNFNYDLLMFAWFFSNMIFFSAHLTKVDRYFATLAPAFAFFTALALNFFTKYLEKQKIKHNIKKIKKANLETIIPLVIISILMVSSFGYLTIDKQDTVVNDEREAVKWISKYDNNYLSKVIWAERGPIFTWYLKKEVIYVNWQINPSQLSEDMLKNNTSYYISIHRNLEIPHFSKIKTIGEVSIYERIY
ncbi:MAG: glycosyltransferase family 39 protein [Methanobrevibacter sp.]|nr:glycosyltransferase family 39 protein [Methanobrevibacter sp.]